MVPGFHKCTEDVSGETVTRAAESRGSYSGCRVDRIFRAPHLGSYLIETLEVKPRLVVEAVIPDLVAGPRNGGKHTRVLRHFAILPDQEECRREAPDAEPFQHSRHDNVKVARQALPTRIAVHTKVGPKIVEIDGK